MYTRKLNAADHLITSNYSNQTGAMIGLAGVYEAVERKTICLTS